MTPPRRRMMGSRARSSCRWRRSRGCSEKARWRGLLWPGNDGGFAGSRIPVSFRFVMMAMTALRFAKRAYLVYSSRKQEPDHGGNPRETGRAGPCLGPYPGRSTGSDRSRAVAGGGDSFVDPASQDAGIGAGLPDFAEACLERDARADFARDLRRRLCG